jgi:hypothetical protein
MYDRIAQAIQREMERCDRVQAFVFFHSLGGTRALCQADGHARLLTDTRCPLCVLFVACRACVDDYVGGCGSGLTTSVVTELAQERLFQPPIINFAFVPSSCTVDPITNRKLTTREACTPLNILALFIYFIVSQVFRLLIYLLFIYLFIY